MSLWQFLLRSLVFHWRMHLAVALGVAAATAVLTGALLVGDSVRGSLKHLALDRLGKIDQVLIADRFFRQQMAAERKGIYVAPAILFPSITAEHSLEEGRRRAAGVMLVGCNEVFWQLGSEEARPKKTPGRGEIVLNSTLATELAAEVGDSIIIRLPKLDQIPADSALGKKQDRLTSLADLKVIEIIPTESLGRFSLQPMQTSPRNAYVALEEIQSALFVGDKEKEKVNTMLVGGGEESAHLFSPADFLSLTLADYGLALKHVRRTFKDKDGKETAIFDYYSLSSDRLLVDEKVVEIVKKAFPGRTAPVFTYLANTIEKVGETDKGKKPIPYSLVTAIDPAPGGPLIDGQGKPLPPLKEDEIALTSWAADDLQVKIGDRIRVTYFAPETTHGQTIERSVELNLAAIIPVTKPSKRYVGKRPAEFAERPTTANDPDLTPAVRGFTDQDTISEATPPFPFDRTKLRKPQDDEYWAFYRTTPKAFVSLKTGQHLWQSRFGNVTSVRIDSSVAANQAELERLLLQEFQPQASRLGFSFLPLRQQSEAASSGTTPFDVLFLLLSMFIIAAALMLVWILFRLGVEQRAGEIGTLQALGWAGRKTARVLAMEGALVAAAGGIVGTLFGIGYAWLMIAGLRTWWVGAVATPFLELYWTSPITLVGGYASGVIVCVITVYVSLRALRKVPTRSLLAGETQVEKRKAESGKRKLGIGRWTSFIAPALILLSLALAIFATQLGGEAQAGAFMGAGASMLAALLILIAGRLNARGSGLSTTNLLMTAFRNAGRNVGRSVTTIALMASASFLIVAVSAFQLDPSDEGVGGFNYLAESSEPILADLNSPEARKKLLGSQASKLDGATILSFRLRSGDDASCRNLYQPHQPRVLGVTPGLVDYFDDQSHVHFNFAASAAKTPDLKSNPWRLLLTPAPDGQPVNVVLDKNTAMYSLKLYRGIGEEFQFDYGEGPPVKFRVAGLLSNSVLQGSLLIGEADFKRQFPTISGYRSFLIKAPTDPEKVASFLEDRFGDEGLDTVDAKSRLADLLAVQNTYISTFRSLGALGLLLGTFGLAAVQLRNVFERRKELALLRAVGFRKSRLGEMVLLENLVLLLGGLATGTLAALFSVLPHMLLGGAHVPLAELAVMLGAVLVVGIVTGLWAVRATLQAPILAALRGE